MITRLATKQLDILLAELHVIALLGPRQVGKTTLARSLAKKHHKPVLYQ